MMRKPGYNIFGKSKKPKLTVVPMSSVSSTEEEIITHNNYEGYGSSPRQYFVYVDNEPLGKKFAELKNVNGQGNKIELLKEHKNILINKIQTVEQKIVEFIPNVNIRSRPYKAVVGIFIEHLSEDEFKKIKLMEGVIDVVVAMASHKHLWDIVYNDDGNSEIGIHSLWNWGYENPTGIWGHRCCSGNGVNVGILDDGVDIEAVAMANARISGGINTTTSYGGDENNYSDEDGSDGHGTYVGGIIAGNPENCNFDSTIFQAFTGIAPDSNLYIIKVCGEAVQSWDWEGLPVLENVCHESDLVEGIEWSMDPNDDNTFTDHLDVINISLGGGGYVDTDPQSVAVGIASSMGVTVVVSAGNHGPATLSGNPMCRFSYDYGVGYQSICSPAGHPLVIAVGAVDKKQYSNGVEFYSSRGPSWPKYDGSTEVYDKPDIVAVGGAIASTASQYNIAWWQADSPDLVELIFLGDQCTDNIHEWHISHSGTSGAAPVVTGLISLIFEGHPEFKGCPPVIKYILMESAQSVPAGDTGLYDVGAGNIDPVAAMNLSDTISFTNCWNWTHGMDEGSPDWSPQTCEDIYGI